MQFLAWTKLFIQTDRRTNTLSLFFKKGGVRIQRMGLGVEMKMFGNYKPTKNHILQLFCFIAFFSRKTASIRVSGTLNSVDIKEKKPKGSVS